MLKVTFIGLLGCYITWGVDWFCTQTASRVSGGVYHVCGTSTQDTLQAARTEALNAAVQEFEVLCNQSRYCRDHETHVEPMRAECKFHKKQYRCFRGLIYTLSERTKKSIPVDVSEVSYTLEQKSQELVRLRYRLHLYEKSEKLGNEIELARKEVELAGLENKLGSRNEYASREYNTFFTLGLGFASIFKSIVGGFGLGLEQTFFSHALGLKLGFDWGVGETEEVTWKYTQFHLQGPVYLGGWYISPELGITKIWQAYAYVGGVLGYVSKTDRKGFGGYAEIGLKKYVDYPKLYWSGVLGLRFGF